MAGYSFFAPLSAISTSPACPFPKPSFTTTSLSKKPSHGHVSCKAGATGGGESDNDDRLFDRRDMLVGLTGAATATGGLTLSELALAADKKKCNGQAFDFARQGSVTCKVVPGKTVCTPELPTSEPIVRFQGPPRTEPIRARRPAHLVDSDYVAKYKKALGAMKALPKDDPHSFWYQAAIHEAFCSTNNYRYKRKVGEEGGFNVHFSWVFAPWHRMYIYFFERIVRKYAEDDSFTLPYWNWDTAEGMALPEMYKDRSSPLYNENRNQKHLDCFVDLTLTPTSEDRGICPKFDLNDKDTIDANLCLMYKQMVPNRTALQFLGDKYCTDDDSIMAAGKLEEMAHTAVHIWTGDQAKCDANNQNCGQDMGYLGTAGRDPVFYAHHANVDRMWHLWRTVLGRQDFQDREWLDTTFVFYDENRQLVSIKTSDVLDTSALKYKYEETGPLPWLDRKPQPAIAESDRAAARSAGKAGLLSSFGLDDTTFPINLPKKGEKVYLAVQRPAEAKGAAKQEEVLVLDVKLDPTRSAKFDVLINVPRGLEAKVGPRSSELAGSFVNLPHGPRGGGKTETMRLSVRFPLREPLTDIKCAEDDVVNVTIVQRSNEKVEVGSVRIELLE